MGGATDGVGATALGGATPGDHGSARNPLPADDHVTAGDRGSGTVLGVGLIAVIVAAVLGALTVAAAARTAHEVALATDLAALSAARALIDGAEDPCGVAATVAQANDADPVSCVVLPDESVQVEAGRRVALLIRLGVSEARATARAGAAASSPGE